MIELISESRCIKCNICVNVCPTNVFDSLVEASPIISRQSDCQTCFMCELYCPTNALYVAPQTEPLSTINEKELETAGLFGSYRNSVGWGAKQTSIASKDETHKVLKQLSH